MLLTQDDASPATLPNREYEVFVNSVVAVIWIVNVKKTWYLGYITEIKENDECIVDHLERVQSTKNELWRFPNKEDECVVDFRQIIGVQPNYEWEVQSLRTQKMRLKNHREIDEAVKNAHLSNYDE